MARFRFVQASEKPVDGFQCMPASDMQPGVVVPRLDTAIGFRDRFKRTDDGGPNCNDTTAPLAPHVNLRRGSFAQKIFFFGSRMVAIQVIIEIRREPGVQNEIGKIDSAPAQCKERFPSEGAPG